MTDHTTIDGLALIKGEITANLTVVHDLIAPEPPEHNTIANAVRALEQVTGALQLLGLPTTARLVDEMARLVDQLDETEPAAVAPALDVLEQALKRLDEHLERLAGGFDEPPLSLWPTIDDVRAASRRMPLTHSELLVLAASGLDGDSQWMPEELEFLAEIMRQVRPQFHRYLLEWYRHDPRRDGLTRMTRLFRNLARHLHEGLLADLFGIVELLCTALEDGRLAVSNTTRALPGRVDWVMKPLAQASPVWPEFEALTLIEQMIEVLDTAGIERQELARLRNRYLADSPERQAEPPLAADPALAALATSALGELAPLKALYDQIAQDQHADSASRATLIDALRGLANRLESPEGTDFGTLPERILAIANGLQELDAEDMRPNSPRLLAFAIELLGVESELQACAEQRLPDSTATAGIDLDMRELTVVTLREAQFEITQINTLIEAWHDGANGQAVAALSGHLQSIVGAMQMLDERQAARIGHLLNDVIQHGFLLPDRQPDAEQFAMLAEVAAALDMFLEHRLASFSGHEHLLEQAETALAQLYARLEMPIPEEPTAQRVPEAPDPSSTSLEFNNAPPSCPAATANDSVEEPEPLTDGATARSPIPGAEHRETSTLPAPHLEPEDPQLVRQRLEASLPGAAYGKRRPLSTLAPDPELLGVFHDEARELLDELETQFRQWRAGAHNAAALEALKRTLHTLKGSARLAGIATMGDLGHALETHLTHLAANAPLDAETRATLRQTLDVLSVQLDALQQGDPLPPIDHLLERLGQAEQPTRATTQQPSTPERKALASFASARGAERLSAALVQARVPAHQLNRLVDQAGEIAIYNTHLKRCNTRQAAVLDEFNAVVARLHEQLHQLERETGAPDAPDRGMPASQCAHEIAKTLDELTGAHALLAEPQQEIANLLGKQARLNNDLQTGLLRTRLAPFAQIVPKLHRLVRRVASDLGKSARLEVVGQEVELDRILLERLVTPLEHLLRNAVDHGLEDPRVRADQGKPIIGTIRLQLRREGNDVAIDVRDDGRGIDASTIVRKARERGLLAPESDPDTAELLPLLLEPGFTTCERSTQISGRGIGLDVVASELQAGGGRIALDSAPGQGTCFTIHLPLDLVLIAAFLVKAGDTTYAVPHNTVEGIGRIAREDLLAIRRGEARTFSSRGEQYEIAHLGCLLEPDSQPGIGQRRWQPLLLARLEERRVAVHVDQLIGSRRVLIKPFGRQMAGIGWLSGGTVLNDGRVALVLDMQALLRPDARRSNGPTGHPQNSALPARACVMVVDDSLTARHATKRWLQRHGIEVILARDGVEALMLLDERRPDLLLLDVEMPRMDGFELTRHIRGSAQLHDLPIVMITSLTDARHRQQARALGIEQYLGKPYRESELLEIMTALLTGNIQSAATPEEPGSA